MPNNEQLVDAARGLVERGAFAVLAIRTTKGDVVLRPIGGRWGSGIIDAIQEMAEKYPGCKMHLFEQCSNFEKYFKGVVPRDQVLPYADYPPETKACIHQLRQEILGGQGDW